MVSERVSTFEPFHRWLGAAVALMGLGGLAGWLVGIEGLKRVAPGLAPMKPNAALALVLLGIALWLLTSKAASPRPIWAGRALASGAIFIGALTLMEYGLNRDLGIDQLLFEEAVPSASDSPPGRMPFAAALNFVLLGAALLRLGFNPSGRYWLNWLSACGVAVAGLITLTVLFGYFYSVSAEGRLSSYTNMPIHTAVAFALLSIAILAARPDAEFVAILSARNPVGSIARRMALGSIVLPAVLGWLFIYIDRYVLAALGWAVAIVSSTAVVLFAFVIYGATSVAARIDAQRRAMARRFEQLVEGAPDGVAAIDREGRFVLFNSQAEQMFGYTRDEVLGQTVEALVPERYGQTHQHWRDYIALPHVRSLGVHQELFAVRKDGAEFPVEINLAPINDGSVQLVMCVIRDVSESKAGRDALKQAELNYRSIVENAVEGILRTTPGGRLLMANPALAEMLGYESPAEFLESIPDVRALYVNPQVRRKLMEILETEGSVRGFECQFVHKSGKSIWVSANARAVRDSEGTILYFEGFNQDITTRKAAEELGDRLRQILEATPDLVSIVDWKTQRGLYLNVAGRRMLGAGDEEVARLGLLLPRPAWAQKNFKDALDIAVREGYYVGECALLRPDGSELPVSQILIAHKTSSGEVDFVATIDRDVTKLKTLEAQFHQAQRVEAIGQFAGGIAHDFNNLLTVISGYSQILLESETLDTALSKNVEAMRNAATRAAALTRQLLAFGRRQVLFPKVINLNTVVSNLEQILRRLIREDIQLVTNLQPDLGQVRADPGQIEQVIINLSINARDAMPSGGALTIDTANAELTSSHSRHRFEVQPGAYVMISVSDTGAGMDEETQSHIFEPFFTTKAAGQGSGLGLSVVYGIVKQSGAYIWLYSEPGRGSTFKIYLPRVDDLVEAPEPVQPARAPQAANETILLVEDERMVRDLTAEVLRRAGYVVLEAEDVSDALRLCKNQTGPLDLILTDVVMPGMSGIELARQARSLRPGLEIVLMSGYASGVVGQQGELDPGLAFIEKPFSAESVLNAIRHSLDRRPAVEGANADSVMILVVDDEPAIREFVSSVLRAEGYFVTTADHGLTALQILKNTRCGLVIADVVMPYKDGIELGVELAREHPEVKLILMSGAVPPARYVGAIPNLKADAILEKPFGAAMLRETVAAVLRQRA